MFRHSFIVFGLFVCLFVCLFGVCYHSGIFHSFADVLTTSEGLQILTYTRHSWHLSSEGSLTCHIKWDTNKPLIIHVTDTCYWASSSGAFTTCLNNLGLSYRGSNPDLPHANTLPLSHHGVLKFFIYHWMTKFFNLILS